MFDSRALLFVFFAFLLKNATAFAQNYTTLKTTNDGAGAAYFDGKKHAEHGEAAIALGYFESALKKDPLLIDAKLALADTYAELRDYFSAERYFEEALAMDSLYAPAAFYFLAKAEWINNKFSEAAAHCRSYLNNNPKNLKNKGDAERLLKSALFADYATRNPVPFNPQSVGDGINTAEDEYFPSLTADASTMVFTRSILGGGSDEDFYVSTKENGIWSKAVPLVGINSEHNEGAQSISPDASWLVFTACNREGDGSIGGCDLYWSQLKKDGWTKPAPFSATINSEDWDSQPSIGADNKSLVFTSGRPGTKGRYDLWMTEKISGSKWKKPERLPAPINTGGKDHTPFLHPDGQTLYFASDSLPGMGSDDLYMSRRNPDGTWSEPVNLGYPINTKASEAAMIVSLDGKTAYFSSNRHGGKGGLDIYSFELPEHVRPKPVNYAKVKVTHAISGAPLIAKVDFIDLATGQSYVLSTTKADGTTMVCLPAGKDYALNISKKKFLFYSEHFNLTETSSFEAPLTLNVALQPIDTTGAQTISKNKPIVLNNIFFETGSAVLLPASTAELDALSSMLGESPALKIQINGHTDNVGNDAANMTLSTARAKAVYDYLIARGIAADRLRYKGFGETTPIATNDTAEGRSRNRRTEFEAWN